MAVGTEVVAVRYEAIVAGAPISVPYPVYEALDILVYYGTASLQAVFNTDYTVSLAGDFNTFTLTPTASLLTKINDLIAANPIDEKNYITVRRRLDYLTDSTAAAVRYTPFTSREFERTVLRFQQIQEQLNRCISLTPNFVGDEPRIQIAELVANRVLMADPTGQTVISGPTADEVTAAQGYSISAGESATAAAASKTAAATSETNAASSATAAAASKTAAATSATNAATSAATASAAAASVSSPEGYIYGLTLSNNALDATNDIDIQAGQATATGEQVRMVLASAITKRLDAAWAVGNGNGGLDTGIVSNTTYHVFLIQRSDTEVVDVLFSLSPSAPTMPVSYNRKRRIGSILREGGVIVPFTQRGDVFKRNSPKVDYNSLTPVTDTLITLAAMPVGIAVVPLLAVSLQQNAAGSAIMLLSDGDRPTAETSVARTAPASSYSVGTTQNFITDTAGRLRFSLLVPVGSITDARIFSQGYIDGRDQ